MFTNDGTNANFMMSGRKTPNFYISNNTSSNTLLPGNFTNGAFFSNGSTSGTLTYSYNNGLNVNGILKLGNWRIYEGDDGKLHFNNVAGGNNDTSFDQSGAINASGALNISGNANVQSLNASGALNISGNLKVNGSLSVPNIYAQSIQPQNGGGNVNIQRLETGSYVRLRAAADYGRSLDQNGELIRGWSNNNGPNQMWYIAPS